MLGDELRLEGTDRQYECPECGHANPSENQFCGMCGAACGETAKAPAPQVTDVGFVTLPVSSSSSIKHYHHHYHHNHYRNSPYLILSIALLLALITWQAGWDYGLRVGVSPTPMPKTQPLSAIGEPKTSASTSSPEAQDREPAASAAVQSNTSYTQVVRDNPYPNELQGFKFYAKDLAPLHPGISERAAVVRVLGNGTRVVGGWSIIPTYITKAGSVDNLGLGRLAEIIIRPEGVIPMGAVRFPAAYAHCHAAVSEMNVSFDVYSDVSGLEYWLYGEDSKWGREGDLYRIAYEARKRHC